MTENENSVKVAIIGSGRSAGRTIREQMELLVRMDELEAYRAIGTIEEFKALKEKSEQKKPNNIPMDDACIYYENHCPNCDSLLVVRYKCCPKCGQKLDWSE